MKHLEPLTRSLAKLGPLPGEGKLRALSGYLELLLEWTDRVDLVSPGSPQELIDRHISDAVVSWLMLDQRGLFAAGACLDVGSGAGLPGLVFAILSPGARIFLCEPRQKRAVFLQEARRRLGLENVTVLNKRLEEVSREECSGVRLATFRALRPEAALLEALADVVEPGAQLAFITGANVGVQETLGSPTETIPYSIPDDSAGRKIILFKVG